jgi:hypothetical protein
MTKITTAFILADKALERACGQACVDWAIAMLEEGRDGHYLSRLAGMLPPYNHFELAALRDLALGEQGIPALGPSEAVRTFAAERLRLALSGEADLMDSVAEVQALCVAHDYMTELYDFYLLYWAYRDLSDVGHQWYWPEATPENIQGIIRSHAERFVRDMPLLG